MSALGMAVAFVVVALGSVLAYCAWWIALDLKETDARRIAEQKAADRRQQMVERIRLAERADHTDLRKPE